MTVDLRPLLVSFDLFSALTDSRTGGSAAFGQMLGKIGGASAEPEAVYNDWDRRNKDSQRDTTAWMTFAMHCRLAMRETYFAFGIDRDADTDVKFLLDTIDRWPLWPDVINELPKIAQHHRLGILSNVDDDLLRRTRAFGVVPNFKLLTSQRLHAYKPSPALYQRAQAAAKADGARFVHVATSSRDVRGALDAGVELVQLRRAGHHLDPPGPTPDVQIDNLSELITALERCLSKSR